MATLSANKALMRQVMFYHFVTGSAGTKAVYLAAALRPGMKLSTMLVSPVTRQPYALTMTPSTVGPVKLAIKATGSSANILTPDQKCGNGGVAHGVDAVLLPVSI